MKYNFQARSIAKSLQSIEQKHDIFINHTRDLPAPWKASELIKAPDPGSNLVAILQISALFGKGLRGHVVYQFRRSFEDNASEDDYIDMYFNPKKIDYAEFIDNIFLEYVTAFEAYYADISDDEFIYMDFDRIRELGIDQRHGIFRISPVSYICKELCLTAFGLSPAEIVHRLQGKVEQVREALDGVFIVLTSKILPTEEMDAICWEAKGYLQMPSEVRK